MHTFSALLWLANVMLNATYAELKEPGCEGAALCVACCEAAGPDAVRCLCAGKPC